jgi:hypothetical protein
MPDLRRIVFFSSASRRATSRSTQFAFWREKIAIKRSLVAVFLILFSATPAFAQERVKFPAGVSSKVLGYGDLWAAGRRGYFEREG